MHAWPGQVLLDCGGREEPLAPALLAGLALLSPNETELARLTGAPSPLRQREHVFHACCASYSVSADWGSERRSCSSLQGR